MAQIQRSKGTVHNLSQYFVQQILSKTRARHTLMLPETLTAPVESMSRRTSIALYVIGVMTSESSTVLGTVLSKSSKAELQRLWKDVALERLTED
jgi:hypothetical protein